MTRPKYRKLNFHLSGNVTYQELGGPAHHFSEVLYVNTVLPVLSIYANVPV